MGKKNKYSQLKSLLLLLMTAAIWGFAFVAQKFGAQNLGNFTFNGIRFLLGAASLLPVILIFDHSGWEKKTLWYTVRVAAGSGALLFIAASLQQYGIIYTDNAGTSSFLTGLYNLLTPILAFLIWKKKTGLPVWIGAVLALGGLYFLCNPAHSSSVSRENYWLGVILLIVSAVFWALQILYIDHVVANVSALKFAMFQFITCGILCLICAAFLERQYLTDFSAMCSALIPILYCGLCSVGIAYTCQIIGQKTADPTFAAIVLSTESVFGALGGVLFGNERMSLLGVVGCVLIFAGILVAQYQPRKRE